MKRWHDEVPKMKLQKRVWGQHGTTVWHRTEKPLGRFRKKHALDCGRARCGLCHCAKLYDIKTKKQLVDEDRRRDEFENQIETQPRRIQQMNSVLNTLMLSLIIMGL